MTDKTNIKQTNATPPKIQINTTIGDKVQANVPKMQNPPPPPPKKD